MNRFSVSVSTIIEKIEAASGAAFHRAAPPALAAKLGTGADEIDSLMLLSARGSNSLYFNRVLGLGLSAPATAGQIEQIVDYYWQRKIRRFAVELSPLAQPETVGVQLIERGFEKKDGSAKLWRADSPVEESQTDFRIERIGPESAAEWFSAMSTVFHQFRSRREWFEARVGTAGWYHYLAYVDNEPAATAALYVQNSAAHLTDMATLAPFRRQGIQAALIQQRLIDGMAAGCHWFTSETAAPKPGNPLVSHRNLLRAGFQIAYIREKYVFVK